MYCLSVIFELYSISSRKSKIVVFANFEDKQKKHEAVYCPFVPLFKSVSLHILCADLEKRRWKQNTMETRTLQLGLITRKGIKRPVHDTNRFYTEITTNAMEKNEIGWKSR